jgi:hypothetical protein
VLGGQPSHPLQLLAGAQARLGVLGQPQEVLGVPAAGLLALVAELVGTERPDRLQHPVAAGVDLNQRFVDQPGQHVRRQAADLLRRGQRGSAGENRQALGHRALVLVEQVPAPGHHRAQRLVPGFGRAVPVRELPQPRLHLVQLERPKPGRREFDAQRQPVDRPADPAHRLGVEPVARPDRVGSLLEQPDRVRGRQRR